MGRKPKRRRLPDKYHVGVIGELDGRSSLAKERKHAYRAICNDLGGEANLSHLKRSHVERVVWLEGIVQILAKRIDEAIDAGDDFEKLLGYSQLMMNQYRGYAKELGLDNRAAKMSQGIEAYIDGKGKRKRA